MRMNQKVGCKSWLITIALYTALHHTDLYLEEEAAKAQNKNTNENKY